MEAMLAENTSKELLLPHGFYYLLGTSDPVLSTCVRLTVPASGYSGFRCAGSEVLRERDDMEGDDLLNELRIDVAGTTHDYEKTLLEILSEPERSGVDYSKFHTATINATHPLKAALQFISATESKEKWAFSTRKCIEHGLSILVHRNAPLIREIKNFKIEMLAMDARPSSVHLSIMVGMKVRTDDLRKDFKMFPKVRPEHGEASSTLSEDLGIFKRDLLYVCAWYSLLTVDDIPMYLRSSGEEAVESFERSLSEIHGLIKTVHSSNGTKAAS